jgi:hypothetical protein
MLALLGNQKGNIAIALALATVTACSAITMFLLGYKDTIDARYDFDSIQEFNLVRSEAARGHILIQKLDYSGEGFYLPVKYALVRGSHSKSTYTLKSRVTKDNVSTGGGLYFNQGYQIRSLATASRGLSVYPYLTHLTSPVKRYGEKEVRRASFAGYHYFTDTDQSMNETPVYFWGPDVIHGRVHSNTDIWLRQGGGGTNNGWPTFFGTVYTSGEIRSVSGTPPYAQVFRADYFEHVGELEFNPQATEIRQHGIPVGPQDNISERILFVTVNGGSFTSKLGIIHNMGKDMTDVWANYPPPSGQYLFQNRFVDYDTLWSDGPSGSLSDQAAFVASKLWLRGNFAGKQTWCSADTLYLVGDCTLSGTASGMPPDGGDDATSPVNYNDMLGLVSEKSIVIKYGLWNPLSQNREKPNCGSDADGIWIYAAMCALGDGNGDPHKDGLFTFEYQHPHPSTPDTEINGTVYDRIDLHRRHYPQTSAFPWPQDLDYPWYNPLWPESFGYMERGTIHLYGSVAQRRRGFVHRNTYDSEYPNPGGIWNIPEDFCGGPSYPSGQQYNAPGATGSGVGYKKDYHFDNRFSFTSPPHFPEVHLRGGMTPFESETWTLKRPPRDL